jgi:type II secretory pathway pseudopilin PulG
MTKNKLMLTAFSLIEVMVAVALISFILTALSINMVYTQRTIKNTQLRAKAIDQANACLNQFRNARDSLIWSDFCQRLEHCSDSTSPNVIATGLNQQEVRCDRYQYKDYRECTYSDSDCVDGYVQYTLEASTDEDTLICPEISFTGRSSDTEQEYVGTYDVYFDQVEQGYTTKAYKACWKDGGQEKATITIIVKYQDFNNNTQEVTVSQNFTRANNEANFCIGSPNPCTTPY